MADTIIRTVELGVRITDAAVAGETTVVWSRAARRRAGSLPGLRDQAGTYRDTVERRVSDVPVVGHPLELRVRVPRYRCVHDGCVREVFAHDTSRLARPGASTTRRCARFILRRLMLDKATVVAVARELGRVLGHRQRHRRRRPPASCCSPPARRGSTGVEVIGVDEHKWAHVRGAQADGFVTVITDLTAVVAGHGPARLLDLVPGPLRRGDDDWLEARSQAFRDQVQIVAMDGFGGYKNAATTRCRTRSRSWTRSTSSPSPAHKFDLCRQRVQQDTLGHRGRSGIRSTGSGAPCGPDSGCSPTASAPAWRRCSPPRSTSRSR